MKRLFKKLRIFFRLKNKEFTEWCEYTDEGVLLMGIARFLEVFAGLWIIGAIHFIAYKTSYFIDWTWLPSKIGAAIIPVVDGSIIFLIIVGSGIGMLSLYAAGKSIGKGISHLITICSENWKKAEEILVEEERINK